MRAMSIIQTTAVQWGLQPPLCALLCTAGGHGAPKQTHGIHTAGRDWTLQRSAHAPSSAQPSGARYGGLDVMEAA